MKISFGPEGLRNFEWSIPNLIIGNLPGFETVARSLMKQTFKRKGVATIEELRDICLKSGVRLISCDISLGGCYIELQMLLINRYD